MNVMFVEENEYVRYVCLSGICFLFLVRVRDMRMNDVYVSFVLVVYSEMCCDMSLCIFAVRCPCEDVP
jgi:hypothetical protein